MFIKPLYKNTSNRGNYDKHDNEVINIRNINTFVKSANSMCNYGTISTTKFTFNNSDSVEWFFNSTQDRNDIFNNLLKISF